MFRFVLEAIVEVLLEVCSSICVVRTARSLAAPRWKNATRGAGRS